MSRTVSHTAIADEYKLTLNLSDVAPANKYHMFMPTAVYPLYENAFRAHRHQSVEDNDTESATLYAEFAKVAANHPCSRSYGQRPPDREAIQKVSPKNRMINSPCQ